MAVSIPPGGGMPPPIRDNGRDQTVSATDDLMAQLGAARREVGKATLASHVVKARAELEGLMQAVRLAQASGNAQHAQALASEAGRIGRTLARAGAGHQAVDGEADTIQGELAATLRMARQVGAIAAGGDPDHTPQAPETDMEA